MKKKSYILAKQLYIHRKTIFFKGGGSNFLKCKLIKIFILFVSLFYL